jgi:ABC-2 type transport system permease protein
MEQAIFGQALREYLRPKRSLVWIVLGVGCALLAMAWPSLQKGVGAQEVYAGVSSLMVFRILALCSAIITTAIVSQEVEQRTIVYLLTRPVPRWKLLLLRYAASVIVVSILCIFAALLTSVASYHTLGGNGLLGHDIEAIFVGALAYGALFLLVSLLLNRAMIICLLFAFGWETMVPNMPGTMDQLSILTHLQAISQHPATDASGVVKLAEGTFGVNDVSSGAALTRMAILIIVCIAVSAWWFTHFEYVPREDAE